MVCLLSPNVGAQPYALDPHVIGGGGGASSGGQYSVVGTIGQPATGAMTGGRYAVAGGFWSSYAVVPTPGGPTLTITRIGSTVEISWAAAGSDGYFLVETDSLTPTINWALVESSPSVEEGRKVVTLPIQPGRHFFSLIVAQ